MDNNLKNMDQLHTFFPRESRTLTNRETDHCCFLGCDTVQSGTCEL